jgi:hypothetical protein
MEASLKNRRHLNPLESPGEIRANELEEIELVECSVINDPKKRVVVSIEVLVDEKGTPAGDTAAQMAVGDDVEMDDEFHWQITTSKGRKSICGRCG